MDTSLSKALVSLIFASLAVAQGTTEVDLGWHAPKENWINNIKEVLSSTGTHGFVFSGSQLPDGVKYGTYNWCNMPHVRREEYVKASEDFELIYVEV